MKKRLVRVGPLKAGIILGILYAIAGLIVAPILIIAALFGNGGGEAVAGIAVGIVIPFAYGIAGFIGGVIVAALYNMIVKFTGGLEFEVENEPATPAFTPPPSPPAY